MKKQHYKFLLGAMLSMYLLTSCMDREEGAMRRDAKTYYEDYDNDTIPNDTVTHDAP